MMDWMAGLSCAGGGNSSSEIGDPAVLVTVAVVEGSGPREPGTKMLVTRARQFGTIGGGHLELRAVEIARAMLADAGAIRLERFALGPSLGQCCGGVVHLLFEPVGAQLAAVLQGLRQRPRDDSWRLSAIDGPQVSVLCDAQATVLIGGEHALALPPFGAAHTQILPPLTPASASQDVTQQGLAQQDLTQQDLIHQGLTPQVLPHQGLTHVMRDSSGRRWLVDPCLAPRAHLTLFGAGHVGAAIVRALADLPCHVTWVDEREDMFPAQVPDNVVIEACDAPEALVGPAPAGGSFLVMTHEHALDLRLSEAILARADVGWFGLIGSHTKRMQFEHRLHARGCAPGRIAAMVCPIGLPGIGNKSPAVVAASVCAQLLMVWEAGERALGSAHRAQIKDLERT